MTDCPSEIATGRSLSRFDDDGRRVGQRASTIECVEVGPLPQTSFLDRRAFPRSKDKNHNNLRTKGIPNFFAHARSVLLAVPRQSLRSPHNRYDR
jgi:hypothetical protein